MAEDTSERKRESPGSEPLNPETRPSETASARRTENAAFVPKCITDKKYPIAAAVVFTIMTIIIIALAVRKPPPCPPTPPPIDAACPDSWIGYRGKCYYMSEEEKNWTISEVNCSSSGATLAVLDSKRELEFLMGFTHPRHYWIGLSREAGKPWKWLNGTALNNQFSVRGVGLCAYINSIGLSSTRCSMEKNFLCSKEDACVRRKQRDPS